VSTSPPVVADFLTAHASILVFLAGAATAGAIFRFTKIIHRLQRDKIVHQ
jgi:hypothetical protein